MELGDGTPAMDGRLDAVECVLEAIPHYHLLQPMIRLTPLTERVSWQMSCVSIQRSGYLRNAECLIDPEIGSIYRVSINGGINSGLTSQTAFLPHIELWLNQCTVKLNICQVRLDMA